MMCSRYAATLSNIVMAALKVMIRDSVVWITWFALKIFLNLAPRIASLIHSAVAALAENSRKGDNERYSFGIFGIRYSF